MTLSTIHEPIRKLFSSSSFESGSVCRTNQNSGLSGFNTSGDPGKTREKGGQCKPGAGLGF